MSKKDRILIIGASGQVGQELVEALRLSYGNDNVVSTDLRASEDPNGPFEQLDVLDADALLHLIKKYDIGQVYNLAAMLSATAEKHIQAGWRLNMQGLFNTLDLAREKHIDKLYWPSSIAVFGPTTPTQNTPQRTIVEPTTVYGISKMAGESWCEYYHQKFGVDVRSVRYPGLIGYKSLPGGGTTDYAVDIFHEALKNGRYTCFLESETSLPMMYMPDAIRATIEIMEAPAESVKIRTSYNLAGMTFNPREIAAEIQQQIPEFTVDYKPDFRQEIAASWPQSIDDTAARQDWNWKEEFDLTRMTEDMLFHLREVV